MNIQLILQEPTLGQPPFEFPKHSLRAFWTEEGRIGVISVLQCADGNFHIMQDIIDVPPKESND